MPDTPGWGPQGSQGPHGPQDPQAGPGHGSPQHGAPPYGAPHYGAPQYPPPPPYGWGHQAPWGPPPPPPPKPGVIPLAPLGLDHILGGAFATMRRYAKPLFGAALAAYAVYAVVLGAALGVAYAVTRDHYAALSADGAELSWEHGRPLLVAYGVVWAAGTVGALAVNSFVQATTAATLHEAVLGRPTTVRAVTRRAWSRTPAVAAVTLLLALILMVPLALLGLLFLSLLLLLLTQWVIPFGLIFLALLVVLPLAAWLYVLFAFAPAAAVLESAGPLTALRRSVRLVRGAWWRTFGISLLAGAMAMIVYLAYQLPLQFAAPEPPVVTPDTSASDAMADQLRSQTSLYAIVTLLGALLTQLTAAVFLPLVTALLYIDRRIRKEGLAHTLAEASSERR
ncbi:oxidoreductase [Streptomyces huasconensis]|uniref:Oxidoreductase n=1 Tax=Streptomyces huasconensis TaxID=1854574 RepID=A0ABV3M7B8_9ACTN